MSSSIPELRGWDRNLVAGDYSCLEPGCFGGEHRHSWATTSCIAVCRQQGLPQERWGRDSLGSPVQLNLPGSQLPVAPSTL